MTLLIAVILAGLAAGRLAPHVLAVALTSPIVLVAAGLLSPAGVAATLGATALALVAHQAAFLAGAAWALLRTTQRSDVATEPADIDQAIRDLATTATVMRNDRAPGPVRRRRRAIGE